jgi:CheY-like chemotaxis protein
MNVLVVDDHPANRSFLETILSNEGHHVASASHGIEALALAREKSPDLIISDVLMPQMDGFTFCREVKKDEQLRKTPFVFYTATYTDPKDLAFGLQLGADRYLVKPMEAQEFLATVADVTQHPRQAEPEDLETDDPGYLKQYNSRLIAKLEHKMFELEVANRALREELATRERLEAQLRQVQKMEAIGRLAGGIAHDFNNILGGIVGFAELAQFEAGYGSSIQSHLDGIVAATQRARDLVQQILAFSRGKERERKPLHLASALKDALKLLRASLPANIELRSSFDPQAPAVLADLTEMHQVATNLVTNAWHSIGDRPGVISLHVEPFHAANDFVRFHPEMKPGDYVRLAVSDDGCGMDDQTIERIFEPFFTTKQPGQGCGLGLSVVHGIVKGSEGAIIVDSKPGKGTMIQLYFPACDAPVAADDGAAAPIRRGVGQRVLFIDDDVTLTTLGEHFLTRLGYEVETENNPLHALARFREKPFDLVVTDLTMPFATGLEVARECRMLRPKTPVLLMTGFNPTLQTDELRAQGIVSILLKPYGSQELGDAVAAALKVGV